ncbi:hypothetical protein [Tsukamurella sp. PLM1]|nr:hypothetical protein [Tsukamurella sp. PLM1]BDH55304.1 hypothetical protein MTP03_02430 [Tsukamurella sp. PLM1]
MRATRQRLRTALAALLTAMALVAAGITVPSFSAQADAEPWKPGTGSPG